MLKFKVGARVINAPLPQGTLQENVSQLSKTFPQFRWTKVLDSDAQPQEDGSLLYELLLPPVKANG